MQDTLPGDKILKSIGQSLLLIVVIYWFKGALTPVPGEIFPWVFLDNANLIFHEAGHWIFYIFGQFLYVLGGSLTQLLIPLIVFLTFLRQQEDYYSAGFALFWLGESANNLSYYIADARAQQLPLISGDALHDWHWILNTLNLLPQDTLIGGIVRVLGIIGMLCGIIMMVMTIWKNFTQK